MITTVPEKTLSLVLSYLGMQSLRVKTKIEKLFKDQLPSGKLEIILDQHKERHLVLDSKTRFRVLSSLV